MTGCTICGAHANFMLCEQCYTVGPESMKHPAGDPNHHSPEIAPAAVFPDLGALPPNDIVLHPHAKSHVCADCAQEWEVVHACTQEMRAHASATRRIVREELDRKPPGMAQYEAACVAYFDYEKLPMGKWSAKEAGRLYEIAVNARPK